MALFVRFFFVVVHSFVIASVTINRIWNVWSVLSVSSLCSFAACTRFIIWANIEISMFINSNLIRIWIEMEIVIWHFSVCVFFRVYFVQFHVQFHVRFDKVLAEVQINDANFWISLMGSWINIFLLIDYEWRNLLQLHPVSSFVSL